MSSRRGRASRWGPDALSATVSGEPGVKGASGRERVGVWIRLSQCTLPSFSAVFSSQVARVVSCSIKGTMRRYERALRVFGCAAAFYATQPRFVLSCFSFMCIRATVKAVEGYSGSLTVVSLSFSLSRCLSPSRLRLHPPSALPAAHVYLLRVPLHLYFASVRCLSV